MINTRLFTPGSVIAIAVIATISHFIARPLYARVSRKEA